MQRHCVINVGISMQYLVVEMFQLYIALVLVCRPDVLVQFETISANIYIENLQTTWLSYTFACYIAG